MNAFPVRVVVEGGSALRDDQSKQISEAFADAGIMNASVEKAAWQRMSSLGWVVITLPFVPFMNAVVTKAGEDSYAAVKRLLQRIRQARPENPSIEMFDTSGGFQIGLRADLPEQAWRTLVTLDLSVLQVGPRSLLGGYAWPELVWNSLTGRWVIHPNTEQIPGLSLLARPVPVTPARQAISDAALPSLPFADDEVTAVRNMVHWTERPMVVANRAYLLYCYMQGASPADIARETFTSDRMVTAVLDDVAGHGLDALDEGFQATRAPWVATIEQQRQILEVAHRDPREFADAHRSIVTWEPSRPSGSWSIDYLAHTIVFHGIAEDVSLDYLEDLLAREGIPNVPRRGL